jgi:DNA-directed RNA polymerase subunit A'
MSKRINYLKFALLSPDEIRKLSAVKVSDADTYDEDGFPIERGLMDLRMGVIEPGLKCKTCNGKVDECPGHFGHIELAMPVVHVGFIKEIKTYLDATCSKCGRVKLDDAEQLMYKNEIMKAIESGIESTENSLVIKKVIEESTAKAVCPHCGAEQKKIMLDKPTTFREDNAKITPREIRERLERVPTDDLPFIGVNPKVARPEWMILTVLPVPPVNVRPTITLETGERSEDDLTHKLVDIIRINQRLRESRDSGAPQLIIEDLWELLQYHITTFLDNQTSGIPPARHRSGRPLKTLVQRLKGKEGRFRANLSGKRVNFSARTVISPEPFISINEVGVPELAARELTVPMMVTPFNIEKTREIVKLGPNPKGAKYIAGANYAIRPDSKRIKITEANAEEVSKKLEYGWIVERQLTDGDIVLFNRQPSLHRMSMMAHRVRVVNGRTFRLNLAVCPPYNADFDGDEMNLHVLQGEEARAEARILMHVQEHIRSPRFGGPIIGGVHDHITGLFLLTYKNPKFSKIDALHILSYVKYQKLPEPVKENGKEYYYGKDLFSLTLPQDMNFEYKNKLCEGEKVCKTCTFESCPYDSYVSIKNGKLISGAIDEKGVGAFKGVLLDRMSRDHNSDIAAEFINNLTRLSVGVISYLGFSTGIDDDDISDEAKYQVIEILNDAEVKTQELIDIYNRGLLQGSPGKSLEETLEELIMKTLSDYQKTAGEVISKVLGMDNSSVKMAKSGARASMLNLAQVAANIGQQAVRGKRIQRGYQNRTLPHFKRDDLGPFAHGYVRSSYKYGLNPTEYFFHAMGGREGLVDTAVRTSRSGYMQRRLINALEDLKANQDSKVVDTTGAVIQFKFGEDGTDPTRAFQGNAVDLDKTIESVIPDYSKKRRK